MKNADLEKKHLRIIGLNIKIRRTATGMTQVNLARKSGVGLSAITAIEKGETISLINLFRIAKALNVSRADFFITDEDRSQITYKTKLLRDKLSEIMQLK